MLNTFKKNKKQNEMVERSAEDRAAETQRVRRTRPTLHLAAATSPALWRVSACLLSFFFGCLPAGTPGDLSCETFPDAVVEQQCRRTTQH